MLHRPEVPINGLSEALKSSSNPLTSSHFRSRRRQRLPRFQQSCDTHPPSHAPAPLLSVLLQPLPPQFFDTKEAGQEQTELKRWRGESGSGERSFSRFTTAGEIAITTLQFAALSLVFLTQVYFTRLVCKIVYRGWDLLRDGFTISWAGKTSNCRQHSKQKL